MPKHEWLVLFLVYSDLRNITKNKLNKKIERELFLHAQEYFYLLVHETLKKTNLDDKAKVVIVSNSMFNSAKKGTHSVTYVHQLVQDEEARTGEEKNKLVRLRMRLKKQLFLNKADDLADLLNQVKEKYDFNRTLLFTYGHGSAFGIFADFQKPVRGYLQKNNLKNIGFYNQSDFPTDIYGLSYHKSLFKNTAKDYRLGFKEVENIITLDENGKEHEFEILTNEEFAVAIEKSFGKVNILVLNNCVMQNVYSQFAFKDTVECLIAPQTGITLPGFNIQGIVNLLNQNHLADSMTLGKQICESFRGENVNPDYSKYKSIIELFVVPAMNLNSYIKIAEVIKKTAQFMLKELDENPQFNHDIYNNLAECFPYEFNTKTGTSMIDLVSFLDFFTDHPTLTGLKNELLVLLQNKTFIFKGDDAYNQKFHIYKKDPVSGLCIYFPSSEEAANQYIKPFYNSKNYYSELDEFTEWGNFLKRYREIRNPD